MAPQYSWPFEFHVVAQKEINAFALPGGPMFVNIGTITAAANEAQLAGVMAGECERLFHQNSGFAPEKITRHRGVKVMWQSDDDTINFVRQRAVIIQNIRDSIPVG